MFVLIMEDDAMVIRTYVHLPTSDKAGEYRNPAGCRHAKAFRVLTSPQFWRCGPLGFALSCIIIAARFTMVRPMHSESSPLLNLLLWLEESMKNIEKKISICFVAKPTYLTKEIISYFFNI